MSDIAIVVGNDVMAHNRPLVSIIVPVYQVEAYLDKCLTSIVGQTYDHLQIIIVDDGSHDSSPRLCDEWALRDERIRVIHKRNGGLGSARNAGLAVAYGDYIWFIDSDDFVESCAVERLVSAVSHQPDTDVVFFGNTDDRYDGDHYTLLSDNAVVSFIATNNKSFTGWFDRLTEIYWAIPAWNKMYRREFLERCGAVFREDVNVAEDQIFNITLYPHVRCAQAVPERLYHYVHRPNSLSASRYDPRTLHSRIEAYRTVREVLSQWAPDSMNFYRAELIMQVSVVIDGLYVHSNGLSSVDRHHIIDGIISDADIREAVTNLRPNSWRIGYIARCIAKERHAGLRFYGRAVALMKHWRNRRRR